MDKMQSGNPMQTGRMPDGQQIPQGGMPYDMPMQNGQMQNGQSAGQGGMPYGIPMQNGQAQNGRERYIPAKLKNQKNPVLAAFLSFLIMLAFLAIQIIVMIPFIVGGIMKNVSNLSHTLDGSLSKDELTKVMLDSVDTIGLTLVATLVSTIVAILWYRFGYCEGYSMADLKKTCKRVFNVRSVAGLFLSAICLFYFCNIIILLIEQISPSAITEYNKMIENSGIETLSWKAIVLTVILAPINEECIMRGIIFTKLKRNMAPVWAIIICAIYFGIFHLQLVQGIYAGVLGLFMAYVAYKYKSIVASMLFHAVFNGLNYILLLLPDWVNESVVLSIAIPVVTGVLWYFLDGKRKIEDID